MRGPQHLTLKSSDIPVTWKTTMMLVAVAKAAVLGASGGLAALGGLDFAFAVAAHDWISEVQRDIFFDYFALGGAFLGTVSQLARMVFFK